MKSENRNPVNGCVALNTWELQGIQGGGFFGCDPSNCLVSYAAHVLLELIKENIEHPIGVAGGYPPK